MSRYFWSALWSLTASLAVSATAFAAEPATTHRPTSRPIAAHRYDRAQSNDQKQRVTLAIGGAADTKTAELLSKALQEHGLPAKVHEQKDQASEVTTSLAPDTDLSAASKAVMAVDTAQKSTFPPSFDFVLFAPLTKDKAKQAMDRLRTLKGVDAGHSHANINKGELWVRINGSSPVTPDDIHNAIRAVGIDAHFMKQALKSS